MRGVAGGTLSTTIGVDYGHASDARRGYENFIGTEFGVRGALRRDEQDVLTSADPYAQAEWQRGAWALTAGVRRSRLQVDVVDRFLGNGNDSGAVTYSHTTPVLGAVFKLTPLLNIYASAARGFETPTLNELFYSGTGGGFNFALKAATSTHVELGLKTVVAENTRINAALFQVRTRDELVVDSASGGRTSYRNASATLRQGAELSVDTRFGSAFTSHLALTALHAVYDQGFGAVPKGSRLPGVANITAFADLAWNDSAKRVDIAVETLANGRVYADDANADTPAPGYATVNARVQTHQSAAGWQLKQFVRLNNLLDRNYIGSVIVGDANKRYYEAAPTHTWLVGASAQYQF